MFHFFTALLITASRHLLTSGQLFLLLVLDNMECLKSNYNRGLAVVKVSQAKNKRSNYIATILWKVNAGCLTVAYIWSKCYYSIDFLKVSKQGWAWPIVIYLGFFLGGRGFWWKTSDSELTFWSLPNFGFVLWKTSLQ